MSSHTYYQHSNPKIRQEQADARRRALTAVSTGRVRWSTEIGLCGGFVTRDRFNIDQKPCLTDAIALHELRAAGHITVIRGRVRLVAQKVSA